MGLSWILESTTKAISNKLSLNGVKAREREIMRFYQNKSANKGSKKSTQLS